MTLPRTIAAADDFAPASDLAILTTYFNPRRYQSRRRNYHLFREPLARSGLDVFTIECAFGSDPFALEEHPGLTRIRCPHVMWQKERLLNHAVRGLPQTCRKVAWVDCDLLFANPNWAQATSALLDHFQVVQLFEQVVWLPRDHVGYLGSGEVSTSFAAIYGKRDTLDRDGWAAHGHTGFGWAARREFLEACGLYDAAILGSGDHLFAHGVLAEVDAKCFRNRWVGAEAQRHHYRQWSQLADSVCQGSLGCVPGVVLHLWHGDKQNRQYMERLADLNKINFDPCQDIAVGPSGCWEWQGDPTELQTLVEQYFSRRQEDG